MRRRGRSASPTVGFESFIDVLANTIGALALLCILAALDAGNLRWRLFISEGRPAATTPCFLVVDAGRVRHLDVELLARRAAELPAGSHRLPADRRLPFTVGVEKRPGSGTELEIRPAPRFPGEPVSELLAGRGHVAALVRKLDPGSDHVYLYLAPDSFRHYLDLRHLCRAAGLQIGWTPFTGQLRLTHGTSPAGRPVGRTVEVGD